MYLLWCLKESQRWRIRIDFLIKMQKEMSQNNCRNNAMQEACHVSYYVRRDQASDEVHEGSCTATGATVQTLHKVRFCLFAIPLSARALTASWIFYGWASLFPWTLSDVLIWQDKFLCRASDEIQGLAKRWSPGCVNAAGNAKQKW